MNKLSRIQNINMIDFLRATAGKEKKIDLRSGELAEKVSDLLKFPVGSATIRNMCVDLDIDILLNVPGGKPRPKSRGTIRIETLENRFNELEGRFQLLVSRVNSMSGYREGPTTEEVPAEDQYQYKCLI